MSISLNPVDWVSKPAIASTFSEGVCTTVATSTAATFFSKSLNPLSTTLSPVVSIARQHVVNYTYLELDMSSIELAKQRL